MTKLAPIAININFDSFNEAFGFDNKFRDPSYFEFYDRIESLANNYNIKFSIYVIGKDLLNPEIASRVSEWSKNGHEIGNHSWSHHMNLGALKDSQIKYEIYKSHEIIYKVTGSEPKGFISPAWSSSTSVINNLINLDYEYDTSIFPSIFLYPMVFKIMINHLKNSTKLKRIISRKDWLYPFTKKNKPFFVDKNFNITHKNRGTLLILPLPTKSIYLPCFWHTLFFVFNKSIVIKYLNSLLKSNYFYYLLHPSDFIGSEDFEEIKKNHYLERMEYPTHYKLEILKTIFDILTNSNREIKTMREIASYYRE